MLVLLLLVVVLPANRLLLHRTIRPQISKPSQAGPQLHTNPLPPTRLLASANFCRHRHRLPPRGRGTPVPTQVPTRTRKETLSLKATLCRPRRWCFPPGRIRAFAVCATRRVASTVAMQTKVRKSGAREQERGWVMTVSAGGCYRYPTGAMRMRTACAGRRGSARRMVHSGT